MTIRKPPGPGEPFVRKHTWEVRGKREGWTFIWATEPDAPRTARWQRRGNLLFDQNGAPIGESPPFRAEKLLLLVLSARFGEVLLGDLAERFPWIQESYGNRFARLWYWRQALGAICSCFGLRVTGALSVATVARLARRLLSR
jgi:hypothetical protein